MAATRLRVTLADGTEVEVIPTLQDTLAFETTLRKNKNWGTLADNALKLQPFKAWNAMRRDGFDLTWEQFTSGDTAALNVTVIQDEDDDPEEAELEVPGLGKGGRRARDTSSSSASPSEPASPSSDGSTTSPPIPD